MTGERITEAQLAPQRPRAAREAPADAAAVESLAAVLRGLRDRRDLHPALYETEGT